MTYITNSKKVSEVENILLHAIKLHNQEVSELKTKAETNLPKPQKLIEFPNQSKYKVGDISLNSSYEWFKFKIEFGIEIKPTVKDLEKRKEDLIVQFGKYLDDYKKVYDQNLPIIENNLLIFDKIKVIMAAIGIPDYYRRSYYKSSRSRSLTTESEKAGYLADLERNIPISQPNLPKKEEFLRKLNEAYEPKLKVIRQAEEATQKAEQEQRKIHELALLRAKYTPKDASSTVDEIIDSLLSKDKYLRLAYFLELNRGDWNDGYDYAERGLNSFEVITETDKLIQEDIQKCINSGNDGFIDGRIFRDTEWNYGIIYELVDNQELIEDLSKLKEFKNI